MIGRSTPRDSLDELDGRRNKATVFCYMDRPVTGDAVVFGSASPSISPIPLVEPSARLAETGRKQWRALVLLMILPQFENASRSYDASAGNVPGTSRPNR